MKRISNNRLQIWLRALVWVLLGSMLVFMTGRYSLRGDFSHGRINSLSEQTGLILDALEKPLQITLYFPDREPELERVNTLLEAFKAGHGGVAWELVDPGRYPRAALADGVSEPGVVVLRYGDKRQQYLAGHAPDGSYLLDQEELAGAIHEIILDRKATIRVMQGPGFRPWHAMQGFSSLKQILDMNHYNTQIWAPLKSPMASVPSDTDLLIIPGPHMTLPDILVDGITDFLADGGPVLLLLDPAVEMGDSSLAAGLEPLLTSRHIGLTRGFVVELGEANRNHGISLEIPVVAGFGRHEVCEAWLRRSDQICLPMVRSLRYTGEGEPIPEPLAFSSDKSFVEMGGLSGQVSFDQGQDVPGPHALAVLSTDDSATGGPLLVIGDSNFATNANIDWEGNADFAVDAIAWLIRDGRRVPPSVWTGRNELLEITRTGRRLYLLFSLALMPLLTFLWPLGLWLNRRRNSTGGTG
ncbi:MAG: hypothetical protein GY835_08455 [bacterium]|nr:hypothetical protein [bacterium]